MKVAKKMSHAQPHRAATPRLKTAKAPTADIELHPGMVISDEADKQCVVTHAFNDLDLVIYKDADGQLGYSNISAVDIVTRPEITKPAAFPLRLGEMIGCGGGELAKNWPDESIPALARPGMVVSMPENNGVVIVQVTPDFCIAEKADGTRVVEHWHAVSIERVQPDLAASERPADMKLINADPFYKLAVELDQVRDRVLAELRPLGHDNKNKDRIFEHTFTGLMDAFDTISTLLSEGTNNLRAAWAKGEIRIHDPHQDHAA